MSKRDKLNRALNLVAGVGLVILATGVMLTAFGVIVYTPPWWLIAGALAVVGLHAIRNGLGQG